MKTGSFAWMSSVQYLAQAAHTLGALAVILAAGLFSLVCGGGWDPVWTTFGVGIALAAGKEFGFDVAPWGEGDSWSDSLLDFAFYVLGGLFGLALVAWAFHLASGRIPS